MQLFRLGTFSRINDRAIITNDGARRQARLVDMVRPENVPHTLSDGQEIVGDDAAVAAPPNRFRAHDRASLSTAPLSQARETHSKRLCQGIIRIVAKTAHPPVGIWRRFREIDHSPMTTQFGDMLIADVRQR